ncbi:unnamed protein product [Gordionus sp. m RMFG-2023]
MNLEIKDYERKLVLKQKLNEIINTINIANYNIQSEELTLQEIAPLTSSTNLYLAVGKFYLHTPKKELRTELETRIQHSKTLVNNLEKDKSSVEKIVEKLLKEILKCPHLNLEIRTLTRSHSLIFATNKMNIDDNSYSLQRIPYKTLLEIYHGSKCDICSNPLTEKTHLHHLIQSSSLKCNAMSSLAEKLYQGNKEKDSKSDDNYQKRMTKLRNEIENSRYKRMVKNILPPETHKDINPNIVGTFAFAFLAFRYLSDGKCLVCQLLSGLISAIIIASTEFYILLKMDYI